MIWIIEHFEVRMQTRQLIGLAAQLSA